MRLLKFFAVSLLLASMAYAMPLNSSARSCIPADLLQLISVDYRNIKDSPTAMAMKQQLLPEALEYVWKGYPVEGAKGTPQTGTGK